MKQKNSTIKFKKSVNKTDDKENENPQKEIIIEKLPMQHMQMPIQ